MCRPPCAAIAAREIRSPGRRQLRERGVRAALGQLHQRRQKSRQRLAARRSARSAAPSGRRAPGRAARADGRAAPSRARRTSGEKVSGSSRGVGCDRFREAHAALARPRRSWRRSRAARPTGRAPARPSRCGWMTGVESQRDRGRRRDSAARTWSAPWA